MKSASLLLPTVALAGLLTAPSAMGGTVVPVASFSSIELEGGGHVTLRHGATQQVTILKGSTDYTRFHIDGDNKLVIDVCNNNCPQNYDLEIEVVTPGIQGVAISGGGEITSAEGFSNQHSISAAVEGGGIIDLRSLDVESADAAVEGGGLIRIRAEHRLNAAVDGGGKITYWGDPQVSSAIDGGGDVRKGS